MCTKRWQARPWGKGRSKREGGVFVLCASIPGQYRRGVGCVQRGSIPYLPGLHLALHGHEIGGYAQDGGARGGHHDQPDVQLRFGPDVFPPRLEHSDEGCACHCGRVIVGGLVKEDGEEGSARGSFALSSRSTQEEEYERFGGSRATLLAIERLLGVDERRALLGFWDHQCKVTIMLPVWSLHFVLPI